MSALERSLPPALDAPRTDRLEDDVDQHLRDGDESERLQRFRGVVRGTMLLGVVFLVILMLLHPELRLQFIVVLSVLEGLALGATLLRRVAGHAAASTVFIGGMLALIGTVSLRAGGIRSPGISAFFVVASAGWVLLGEPGGMLTGAACSAIGLGLVLVERAGLLAPPVAHYSPVAVWLINGFYVGFFLVLVRIATRSLSRAASQARLALAEQVRSERHRQALSDQLKQFITHTPAAIAVLDRHLCYLQVSERWIADYRLTGDLIGRSHYEVFPNLPQRWHDVHQRVLAGAVERCSADSFVRQDGVTEWLEWECRPWLSADGEVGGVIMLTQVITARKQAEQRIAASEARFRALTENAQIGVFIVQEHRITYANPALEDMLGYGRGELTGEDPHAVLGEVAAPPSSRADASVLRYEAQAVRRDGTPRLLAVSTSTVNLDDVRTVIGNVADVTEQRSADSRLAASEARFRALIEQAPTAINISRGGITLYVNRRYVELFGLASAADAEGKPISAEWAPSVQTEISERARRRSIGLQEATRFESLGQRRDGSQFPVQVQVAVVDLPDGPATLKLLSDVSDRVLLETEFRQAQKMEAVGRLAGGIAHDFNNLLTIVIGCGELALAALPDPHPQRGDIEEMLGAADRAAELTHQLLAFSRRQMMRPRTLNLNAVVAGVSKMLDRLIGDAVTIVMEPAPDLASVQADQGQIEQVLANLVVNARDAMPRGGRLHISTANVEVDEAFAREHPQASPGPYVRLTVRDTGVGMTLETRSRLFEPFFTTKEPGKGTGLGLATVYGIVAQSFGFILVQSEPGLGTSFDIYLPACANEADGPLGLFNLDAPTPARGTETILLVEDNAALRRVVAQALASFGYKVLAADDSREALRLARTHPGGIDLLLTDVEMPDLSGPEVADLLVAEQPALRVIFMTGYTDNPATIKRAVGAGALLLQKPFTPIELSLRLRHVLDSAV
jgi:PAS domain S-box-containing protein